MSASCTDACSRFSSAEELAEFLDGLHEMTPDGVITGRKWSVAQRARAAILAAAEQGDTFSPTGTPQECDTVEAAVMLAERALWQDDEGVRWVPEASFQRMVSEVERLETALYPIATQPEARGVGMQAYIEKLEHRVRGFRSSEYGKGKQDGIMECIEDARAMLAAAPAAPLTAEDIRRIIREELAASRPEWRGGPR